MTRYFKHLKTGGIYELIGDGIEEATMAAITIYKAQSDGTLWTRPRSEFYDGRFVEVHPRLVFDPDVEGALRTDYRPRLT